MKDAAWVHIGVDGAVDHPLIGAAKTVDDSARTSEVVPAWSLSAGLSVCRKVRAKRSPAPLAATGFRP